MIVRMDRPLANDHQDGPASCKWSSGWTDLLQMIIRMDRPFANDHPDWPASCKWSSWWTILLQMIIRNNWPLANDHLDWSVYCKWLTGSNDFLQMIIWMDPLLILISFSFSVHLFLHRPKTQISRIIGQYTHNLLGLKTLSFALLLFIHKNMD